MCTHQETVGSSKYMARVYIKGLNAYLKKYGKDLKKDISDKQTLNLVEYAKATIQRIGDKITSYTSQNNMDRTGNLLDSLCWGLVYNGKLVGKGFYRQQKASEESYLHEWLSGDISSLFPVYGHGLAEQFIQRFAKRNSSGQGWRVFFAVLAPYWGYWEEGFRNVRTNETLKFHVMTEVYDVIKADLKPAKVTFHNYVPKYNTNKKNNLNSLRKNIANDPYKEKRHFKNIPRIKTKGKK